MMLPSGKTLRESTREEIAACGSGLARIAAELRPGQTVAEAGLTEDRRRELYEPAAA
jgi:hypothetical protein